jgi:hypothetical protein
VIFCFKKLISAQEDMKIKKNTFSTLVLELFFPSIANCRKLKIQKSTSPSKKVLHMGANTSELYKQASMRIVVVIKLKMIFKHYE